MREKIKKLELYPISNLVGERWDLCEIYTRFVTRFDLFYLWNENNLTYLPKIKEERNGMDIVFIFETDFNYIWRS